MENQEGLENPWTVGSLEHFLYYCCPECHHLKFTSRNIFLQHCRMRSPSSALVMAANQTSAIGVLFDVDYDVIVRNGCFQRGTTLKFLKYFRTFFVSILGQSHGVLILFEPIKNGLRNLFLF